MQPGARCPADGAGVGPGQRRSLLPCRFPDNQDVTTALQTVLGVILGGGAGSRLYPLTKKRAKPAVPLGANYRLIDIPVSNCINSNVNKIYCLTQFNSASLNRHLSQAYVSAPEPGSAVHRVPRHEGRLCAAALCILPVAAFLSIQPHQKACSIWRPCLARPLWGRPCIPAGCLGIAGKALC